MSNDVRIFPMQDGRYAILRGDQNLICGLTEEEARRFQAKFAQKKRLKTAGSLAAPSRIETGSR